MTDILIRGYKAKEQIEDIIKEARYAANNCMIGSGLEIIELPEHGDLIDLDAVVNCQYYDDMYEEWSIRTVTVRDVLYGCLEAMPPVVIPSNKEDTE